MKNAVFVSVLAALLSCSVHAQFVSVQGTKFVKPNCDQLFFVGANTWRLIEAQAGILGVQVNGKSPAEWLFETAAANNISVIRMFATGVEDNFPLKPNPDQYNEEALRALDEVVALAEENGVLLTLVLANNWSGPDLTRANFVSWYGVNMSEFWTDEQVITEFLNHASFMMNRTNTVTGRKYNDDPTIFSWQPINEARYFSNVTQCENDPSACADNMHAWIERVTTHMKENAPNQLISIGYEGFFGPDSDNADANPPGGWADSLGHNFERDLRLASVDYGVFHLWVDNWEVAGNPDFIDTWIQTHMDVANEVGKPLVLEEWSRNVSAHDENTIAEDRIPTFQDVFQIFNTSVQNDDVLKGIAYWMWDPNLQDVQEQQNNDAVDVEAFAQDQVFTWEATFTDVIAPTARYAASQGGPVENCTQNDGSGPSVQSQQGRKLLMV